MKITSYQNLLKNTLQNCNHYKFQLVNLSIYFDHLFSWQDLVLIDQIKKVLILLNLREMFKQNQLVYKN